jgi:hypothetical protein
MISTSVVPVFPVVKERSLMPTQSALTDRHVAPAQVWAKLSVEIQIRAVGLLAQLLLNVVVSRTRAQETEQQEVSDVELSDNAQNPT